MDRHVLVFLFLRVLSMSRNLSIYLFVCIFLLLWASNANVQLPFDPKEPPSWDGAPSPNLILHLLRAAMVTKLRRDRLLIGWFWNCSPPGATMPVTSIQEINHLLREHQQDGSWEDVDATATTLLNKLDATRKARWIETIEAIDLISSVLEPAH